MTQEPSRSGQDPIGEFQRWLVRSGARSVSREVSDQIRSVLGGRGGKPVDVWEQATAPPTDEAPECAWCPVCRAARVLREQGPGMSSQVSAASEAMGVFVHDALTLFESALSATGRMAKGAGDTQAPSAGVWTDVTGYEPAAEPEAADLAEEPGTADLAGEPGPADLVEEPIPTDLADEPGLADLAEEPGLADLAGEPGPADLVEEPALTDLVEESGTADLTEEPGMADLAEEPGAAGLAEEPGTVGLAEEPGPAGSPAEPPDDPDDRG
ncbi:MAG TPA: hypothetical protein VEC76_21030 [Streptosporangiaceae bacterium]|nr:hypothetical protein [Streptosporangiaceae bacterium]